MIKNYSTVAWRNLRKNKIYSAINIIGLALGMAVSLLIGLWVWDELTFNHSFRNHDRLAEIVSVSTENGSSDAGEYASAPVGAELKRRLPDEIKEAVVFTGASPLLAVGDKKISSGASGHNKPFRPCLLSKCWLAASKPLATHTPC